MYNQTSYSAIKAITRSADEFDGATSALRLRGRRAESVCTAPQVRRGIMAAKARLKDPEVQRALEGDLVDSVELLEHSANLALAALFLVRASVWAHN